MAAAPLSIPCDERNNNGNVRKKPGEGERERNNIKSFAHHALGDETKQAILHNHFVFIILLLVLCCCFLVLRFTFCCCRFFYCSCAVCTLCAEMRHPEKQSNKLQILSYIKNLHFRFRRKATKSIYILFGYCCVYRTIFFVVVS